MWKARTLSTKANAVIPFTLQGEFALLLSTFVLHLEANKEESSALKPPVKLFLVKYSDTPYEASFVFVAQEFL